MQHRGGTMGPDQEELERVPVSGVPSGETPFEAEAVLSRVRDTISRRRAAGDAVALPQALLGFEADELEALEYQPWKRVLGSRAPIDVSDLADASPETVVRRCHRILLLRDPKESEIDWGERMLARGWTPIVIVGLLRWSREGRAVGVPVRGLAPRWIAGLGLSLVRRCLAPVRRAP